MKPYLCILLTNSNFFAGIQENGVGQSFTNWGSTFSISFEIQMNRFDWDGSGMKNVVHVTKDKNLGNTAEYGYNIPAVYVDGSLQSLVIYSAINDETDFRLYYSLMLGKFYKVFIGQEQINGKTFFQVYIDDKQIYEIENHKVQSFEKVNVYDYSTSWKPSIKEFAKVLKLKIDDFVTCE